MWVHTYKSKGIDIPTVSSQDDITRAQNDEEGGEELDVLAVDGPNRQQPDQTKTKSALSFLEKGR